MAVLVDDLKKKVLDNVKKSDRVTIITGYFSPDMIDEIEFNLFITMVCMELIKLLSLYMIN